MAVQQTSEFSRLVQDAKSRIRETNIEEVKRRLNAGEKLNFVDVREDSEWQRGHIPDAIHLGKGVIERDIEATVPDKDTELILYCGGGSRSALAADSLRKMGYHNALSMDGGWRAWGESGLPKSTE
jgi:rhodanese-related sulfurtransferase